MFLILTSSSKAQAALLAATSISIPRGIASCWLHWLIEVASPGNQKNSMVSKTLTNRNCKASTQCLGKGTGLIM